MAASRRIMLSIDGDKVKITYTVVNERNETVNVTKVMLLEHLMNYTRSLGSPNMTHPPKDQDDLECGGGFAELAVFYANSYHPYAAIAVCLFGLVANILNIAVLTRKDMACAPINRILTALAVADMLLMLEYIPFAYYYHIELRGKMDFPYMGAAFILLHNHLTQVLHTISICLTLTLAVWRYLAIGYPEKNHILCSERRCTLGITLSYLLPIVLCVPSYFTLEITSTEIYEDKSYILYHTSLTEIFLKDRALLMANFWVYAVFIKLLPCCILTVISCWLIKTLFKAKKRKQVLRGYECYPLTTDGKALPCKKSTKGERRADRTTKMLVAVLLLFLLTEFPQGLFAIFIGLRGKDLFLECYQMYGEVMDMLALLNGSINFILYCCMNRMFRATFGQMFKHKILLKWAPSVPSEVHTTVQDTGTHSTELSRRR